MTTPPLELAARLEKLAETLDHRGWDDDSTMDTVRAAADYIRKREGETTALRASVPSGDGAGGADQWQPIETAPRDGTWIVVMDRYRNVYSIYWDATPLQALPERGPRGWIAKGGYAPCIRIEPDVILGWIAAPTPDTEKGGG